MGKHSAPKQPVPVAKLLGGTAAAIGVPFAVLPAPALAAPLVTPDALPDAPDRSQRPLLVPTTARFAAPTESELARLRFCEASGRYATNTGNGFYGAYQFDAQTWRGLGLPGLPHQAHPDLQDAAASALEMSRGWQPWPACSRRLGLVPRRSSAGVPTGRQVTAGATKSSKPGKATHPTHPTKAAHPTHPTKATHPTKPSHPAPRPPRVTATPAPGTATHPTHVATPTTPRGSHAVPSFAGHVLTTADAGAYRSDVRLWQERMAQRGWAITVDGIYGRQSAAIAQRFAAEKGIREGFPGEVGPKVWAAAWSAPVSHAR